jgi:hypothetical protein
VLKQSNTIKTGAVHVPSIVYLDNNKQCPPKSHVQILSNLMCRQQSRHVHVVRTYITVNNKASCSLRLCITKPWATQSVKLQ